MDVCDVKKIYTFTTVETYSSVPEPLWNYAKEKFLNFRIDFFYCSVISPFAINLFLLPFNSHCSMQNIGFSDSGYVIEPLQPSSAIYGAPPFTGYRNLHPTSLCDELWFWCKHFFITVRYDYVWGKTISSSVCIKSR